MLSGGTSCLNGKYVWLGLSMVRIVGGKLFLDSGKLLGEKSFELDSSRWEKLSGDFGCQRLKLPGRFVSTYRESQGVYVKARYLKIPERHSCTV